MNGRLRPTPFPHLLAWLQAEWEAQGSVFGCTRLFRADAGPRLPFMGAMLETPFGAASGPHTQLAQNMAAVYACGGRFFELKTVQALNGDALQIHKPSILAEDAGFNCE